MELGKVGVWWSGSWSIAGDPSLQVASEIESLGYEALWSSGGFNVGLSTRFERLLGATTNIAVASGIVNIWRANPVEVQSAVTALDERHPGRFVLGVGASHAPLIENYSRPYGHMVEYLDALDSGGPAVAKDRRILAALGPRMLELAASRAAGAHPYFVPVEHTARARRTMGAGPILAPEVTVVVEPDKKKAHELARRFTTGYLSLPNYANNLRSLGFADDDVAGGGSDRLIDALIAWGGPEKVAAKVHEHHEAGADHVCVQVVSAGDEFPLETYRELASVLLEP